MKVFPLKPHDHCRHQQAARGRPKLKIAEKLDPGTLDVVKIS
jgi:hypothetical protein